jgi:hypothetical protein
MGTAAVLTPVAMLLTLIVFVVGINLVIDEYGKGAIRAVVDEAARAGSVQGAIGGPVEACQAKAAEVMGGLLGGSFGKGISVSCALSGNEIVAVASGSLPDWMHVVPAERLHVIGTARVETNPTPAP